MARDSGNDGSASSRAAGWCAKVFFPPFWSRTAHIVIFWVVSPVRSVPGRTEKRHQSADAAAQKRNKNGCSERNLSHVILHRKMWSGIERRMAPINRCERGSNRD